MSGSSDGQHLEQGAEDSGDPTRGGTRGQGAAADPGDSVFRLFSGSWKVFLALLAVVPGIATFFGLWFTIFPGLKPPPVKELRSVAILDLGLGERHKPLGYGAVTNTVIFQLEAIGYDEDSIAVDWPLFDAETRIRLDDQTEHQPWLIDVGTRTDRIVGEIEVDPPTNHVGCVFVRVYLQPEAAVETPTPEATVGRVLLDVADTATFDPFVPSNESCPDGSPLTDRSGASEQG